MPRRLAASGRVPQVEKMGEHIDFTRSLGSGHFEVAGGQQRTNLSSHWVCRASRRRIRMNAAASGSMANEWQQAFLVRELSPKARGEALCAPSHPPARQGLWPVRVLHQGADRYRDQEFRIGIEICRHRLWRVLAKEEFEGWVHAMPIPMSYVEARTRFLRHKRIKLYSRTGSPGPVRHGGGMDSR